MPRRSWLILGVLFLAVCGAARGVWAHGMRTGYLELAELRPSEVEIRWRAPDSAASTIGGAVHLTLPAHCQQLSANGKRTALAAGLLALPASDFRGSFQLRCQSSLFGETLRLSGLGPQLSEVVGLATFSDGVTASRLLTGAAPSWRLGDSSATRRISAEYVSLGLRHIMSGADHLLFLLLLTLAVRRLRGLLLAETAFTLSHTLSFCATALGWVQVSAEAAEACIALSLLLLALDVQRPGRPPLSSRKATMLTLVFGLVHGLGFAGGLQEIGLPEQAAAWALLGFGFGVELGQLAFLLLVVGLLQLLSGSRLFRPTALGATYAAGGLSACWLIERVLRVLESAGSAPWSSS